MSRQDRQGVRTAVDLERKYDFTQSFTELESRTSMLDERIKHVDETQALFMSQTGLSLDSLLEDSEQAGKDLSSLKTRMTKAEHKALQMELSIRQIKANGSNNTQVQTEINQLKSDVAELEGKVADIVQGSIEFTTDETLSLEGGVLSVNTAMDAEQDNTLPITSAAVYTEIGNINTLLATI